MISHAEHLEADALSALNAARAALGAEPLEGLPAGVCEDAHECPVARALSALAPGIFVMPEEIQVTSQYAAELIADAWESPAPLRTSAGSWRVCTPRAVFGFACAFDDRKLSDDLYEASAA